MENLNAEKVKEALMRCASGGRCKGCVRENITALTLEGCMGALLSESLALIESQEERIEAYRQELAEVRVALAEANCDKKKLTEEAEGLKQCMEHERASFMETLDYAIDKIRGARIETVRKMHSEIKERCIKGGIYPAFVASTIDQIAKELEGEI